MTRDGSASGPLVVLLGTSTWPRWPALDSPVFERSYALFRDHLGTARVPPAHVLDLFGSTDGPDALVRRIREFLADPATAGASDVLVYYVGHGDRIPGTGDFAVFTGCADQQSRDSSAFRASYLAEATRESGRRRRTHLILDACFSATATEAFGRPVGNAGVTVFASASSGDASRAGREAATTPFTGALVTVLRRGEPELGRRLNLRDLRDLVEDEILARGDGDLVRPELHSPQQRRGDAATIGLFPNAAHGYAAPSVAPTADRAWCVVVSAADAQGDPGGVFADAMVGFIDLYRNRINRETGWLLREKPTVVTAAEVFRSPRGLQRAVADVCAADLVFFDLTGLEPAALVLLGIRAIIRRGVSICSTGGNPGGERSSTPPFLLRDVNMASHGPGVDVPEEVLGSRAIAGIREFTRAPHRYTDLPGFDVIRQLPPTLVDRTVVPYHESVLVLCPFNPTYNARNWRHIRRRLAGAIAQRATGRQADADSPHHVRVERTLDMTSPRLVSANLLEAIRLTDLCLVDLTGWKPNVLFELGLRLAARPVDPVCVIDRTFDGRDTLPDRIGDQCAGLLSALDVIEYQPSRREDYYRIVDRHLHTLESLRGAPARTWSGRRLPVGGLYRVAWQYADPANEATAVGVVDLLRLSAAELSTSKSRGSTPFVFPVAHSLTHAARRNATERLVAAWLYLRHRQLVQGGPGADEAEALRQVGYELTDLLADSVDEADQRLATEVYAALEAPPPERGWSP